MYALDVIKKTSLAKKLGGPPIFHDGYLKSIEIEPTRITLNIEILSQVNPLLSHDTLVTLRLKNIHAFNIVSSHVKDHLLIIHDLDIRNEGDRLHLMIESNLKEVIEIYFESIEFTD
ncbi:MAG: hypothetical protein ACOCUE_02005 [Candidatus Izemoplasmataceae bacterium]